MRKREDERRRLKLKREGLRQLAGLPAEEMARVHGGWVGWGDDICGRGQSKGCC